jgi:hypothetical protein
MLSFISPFECWSLTLQDFDGDSDIIEDSGTEVDGGALGILELIGWDIFWKFGSE